MNSLVKVLFKLLLVPVGLIPTKIPVGFTYSFFIKHKVLKPNLHEAGKQVNVKDHGAKADGVANDTQAIINSIIYAKENALSTVYFPEGTYLISDIGKKKGIIPLLNGISLKGSGIATCHIKLSGGRYNPNSLFYQDWVKEPSVSNLVIEGINFDGNLANQRYDASYQYCLAFSINNGENIEIKNCKFESFRGDGCLFGDTFETSRNLRITSNVKVHDNEFYNIYREGAMFCCTKKAFFYDNYIHGSGYLVGGVDIERHSANETVLNISVYNNKFDFRDGFGPVERGAIVRYRRAVTMGFFYAGYANKTADQLSAGHQIYGNTIYQGQIDDWGHTNVSITGNTFTNTFETINGVSHVSTPVINVSDPAVTSGLTSITVNNNTITSSMLGNGIYFNNYSGIIARFNKITNTRLDGISLKHASGIIDSNIIRNVGLSDSRASGIAIDGNCSNLIVSNNQVIDTHSGNARTISYAIRIQSANNSSMAPKIVNNQGKNMFKDVIKEFPAQKGYAIFSNNKQ